MCYVSRNLKFKTLKVLLSNNAYFIIVLLFTLSLILCMLIESELINPVSLAKHTAKEGYKSVSTEGLLLDSLSEG